MSGILSEIDAAGQVVAGIDGALVRLKQRFVKANQYRQGGQRRQVDHFKIQLPLAQISMYGDMNRDHVRLLSEHAADGGVAVLSKGANGVAGVDDFEKIGRASCRE